jgi:hypothetical protein
LEGERAKDDKRQQGASARRHTDFRNGQCSCFRGRPRYRSDDAGAVTACISMDTSRRREQLRILAAAGVVHRPDDDAAVHSSAEYALTLPRSALLAVQRRHFR